MELLSRDIKFIVHRYIFDYNYTELKRQYRFSWLNNNTSWDDDRSCFMYADDVEANWANKNDRHPGTSPIYRFRTIKGDFRTNAVLPKNY